MTPRVSILLLSWNTRDLTRATLDSLPGSVDKDGPSYEVVVVDNGSRDGSAEALAQRPDITLIRNESNLGFAPAVNQAFRCATGELILLLNSDARLAPSGLSALVQFLDDHPAVAGVGPRYLNPDGTPQAHHYRFPTFAMTLANVSTIFRRLPGFSRRFREYQMLDVDFTREQRVPQPSATCLLLRRTVLAEDAVFDERYPIFFNDVALARSLANAGHELWMTPTCVVFHERSASTRQLGGSLKRQYLASLIRYLEESEPAYRLLIVRTIVLLQGLALALARRPRALPVGELWPTLRGDVGPVPQAPQSAHVRHEVEELLVSGAQHAPRSAETP
jgi:GT2 family glycosyltransferase